MTHPDRIQQCRDALYSPPMTPDELREFNQSKARRAALDELERAPQPQLELVA